MIIDVDAHFEPGDEWLDPYPELAAKLPDPAPGKLAAYATVGDLIRDMPEHQRPSLESLAPPGMALLYGEEKSEEAARRAEFEGKNQFQVANAEARVKWLDEQGIDRQHVICLAGYSYTFFIDDISLRQDVLRTCNSWLAETCAPTRGRLLPVTCADYEDLDFAIAELKRMRKLGSRIFMIPAYPVAGIPPMHPSWDKLWSTAVSLGMVPMLHTGFERMRFDPGWANIDDDPVLMRMLCSAHRHVAPTTLVNSLIYSGVFERFPNLTLLLAEVGTGWLPFLFREIDDRVAPVSELFLGKSGLPKKPSEYLARNVRATPLNGGNDQPIVKIMDELPDDMIVFSSDFPHFEGFTDPIAHYSDVLADLPEKQRTQFYGGAIADVFARMGDPIV